jgi:2,3-bisphosphoglycerate-dependent phosphoglycerate mutase
MTRLLLVRHGESVTTVARRIGGPRTCGGLTDLGYDQAARLRDRWRQTGELHPDALISSQFPRARQTADVIAEAFPGIARGVDEGWGEHDPGPDIDGLSFGEYVERHPDAAKAWESQDPDADVFPGGETLRAFHQRVEGALQRTLSAHEDRTVVVACHGGVVDAVLRHVLRTPPVGEFEIHTLNTSITEVHRTERGVWRLVRYNDTAHLAGLPAATSAD